ncbi:growth factor receptor domain-containing protein [Ramaria rubella]|nr:growth factor receptor domain-containing protein [Ramaria rubella]
MISLSILLPVALAAAAAAQSNSVVCVAGQCLQGVANTTLGATLNIPSNPTILLLPGQYTSSSQPQLLHDALSSSQARLSLPSGFSNSSTSSSSPTLPLNVALQPGVLSYPQTLYRGEATFTQLPSGPNRTTATLPPGSFLVAPNTWAALTSSNNRIIIWDAIPDFAQLPSTSVSGALSLTDIESAACSPVCASSGTCTPSGQCSCAPGFTGQSCETCSPGFFGSTCQPCPSGCATCDQGLTGSGKCLVPVVSNSPSSCNCLNGVCGSNGQCTCNAGWTSASNGTACASCAAGFFLDSNSDCSICQLGCTQCSDGTGECTSCKSGFTQNANDNTKCIPVTSTSTAAAGASSDQPCPDGSFSNGGSCALCSPSCKTCSGPTSSDCIVCGAGQYTFNGQCVGTDANGVCSGTNLIANNNKEECDSCPAKCTQCRIPGFNAASTTDQAQCTGCLPGFVLSQGKCVAQCPSGTFLASDNLTCTACDSTCSTCVGNSQFCLTCGSNQLASNGTCTTSCPSNTFSSSGACLTCHPDCATCSGGAFNQCNTCSSSRPVLSSGRCLSTCSRSQFLDTTSSTCQACDSSCSSCSGAGPNSCLACSSESQVLKAGACVASSCTASSSVVPNLGVCLSDLVAVPDPTSSTPPPLPTLTPPPVSSPRRPLAWWEILLMALGCAFIFVIILWLWRRRARKQRAKQTALFATKLKQQGIWRRRLGRFADLFRGHKHYPLGTFVKETEHQRLQRMRDMEAARHEHEMSKLESAYAKSAAREPSPQPSIDGIRGYDHVANRTSAPSLYSQLTGLPRKGPEPKQPSRELDLERGPDEHLLSSRFSVTTTGTSVYRSPSDRKPEALPPLPSEAETYAAAHAAPASYWLIPADPIVPTDTGGSKNPFRR